MQKKGEGRGKGKEKGGGRKGDGEEGEITMKGKKGRRKGK